ncbi:glycosyltransferase involved in cell wall biosynthesis [Methylobacter tundripaludum]|uniref:Glycosyltransferase involved in cell wall biosynthesis n=1 Tax=Methylobacter tundripaludum TaxID=173365 RepID=A0A2S6H255_9GAMM|nr:hypothetical protein [Methylobacter tundripaludum]PPK71569.1 glycosyltransferase involved in cell wall biosynthesis [Methylobacter tundripaludum]
MTKYKNLSVAVPWSLSHYIPLNGFHPLYRALFDHRPENITINAWDNIELSQVLHGDNELRVKLLKAVSVQHKMLRSKISSSLAAKYIEGYFPPNIALTSLLPGDIEFHHTAPFPSLTRPFVFHCESFAPIFFPFSHQGKGKMLSHEKLRSHYRRILGDPLCLGIFSHVPETLQDISHFFNSPAIDAKLHPSRIGLGGQSLPKEIPEKRGLVSTPRFLFVNSANQNPVNFFHCGGHVVLRFWQKLMASGRQGKLYLRCARPSDELLSKHGVDVAFLHREECNSVIWIQDYLTNQELNALMTDAHFFLLPSASLHSVSTMQAMALGTVPVIFDTVGTSLYVKNDHNGIVLEGVFSTNCMKNPATGVLIDNYHRNRALDDSLVRQLTQRITELLVEPDVFDELRQNALADARSQFSGSSFSNEFWATVQTLFTEHAGRESRSKPKSSAAIAGLEHCTVDQNDWARIFESVQQPVTRIFSGNGRVTELGGAFIHTIGSSVVRRHNWSALAEYYKNGPRLTYAKSIKELEGRYMSRSGDACIESRFRMVIDWTSRLLSPFPRLHRVAARILKVTRKRGKPLDKWVRSELQLDVQLVKQDASGFNVIRYFDKYYAIPQHQGEFLKEKADNGDYSICFVGNSVKEVLRQIAEHDVQTQEEGRKQNQNNASAELIEEGIHGFNIIRFLDCFYAIPQSEGAFEYDRFLAGGYSRIYTQQSVADIKAAITRHNA